MQSDGLNSALSPVVYGDLVLSIKINTHNTYTQIHIYLSWSQSPIHQNFKSPHHKLQLGVLVSESPVI